MANQGRERLYVSVDWRRRHEQAIAWGQAMFSGGGNVTPAHGYVLGREYMRYGPTRQSRGLGLVSTKESKTSSQRHRTE